MKKAQDYTHLHVHSVHSLLDGFTRVKDLVETVKSYGQSGVALTDHGNMAGIPTLWREAKEARIKPIAGMEAYICEDATKKEGGKDKKRPYYHITLLAKDQEGYGNLCRLSRYTYTEGFYSKPRLDVQALRKHHKGVVCLSGCVGGWPQQLILSGKDAEATSVISDLYETFGEDFYLEMQDTGEQDQKVVNAKFIELSELMGIPLVLTGDSHYTKKEDYDLHDTLLCIGLKKPKSTENRIKFVPGRYHVADFPTLARLGYSPEYLSASKDIDEKCKTYELPRAKGLPAVHDSLEVLATEGLKRRMPEASSVYWDRLFYELGVIYTLGFETYFLTIHKIIKYADECGMFHGWGRGSSAGSLVSYSLGITNLDPLAHGLYFERFLNSSRQESPDIDLDFTDVHRPEIVKFLESSYGKECVSQVGTYGTLGPKQVLIDTCKVLGKNEITLSTVLKCLPKDPLLKISDVLANAKLVDIITRHLGKEVVVCIDKFNEIPRHASSHAAGVVVDSEPLTDKLPMMSSKDKETGERTKSVTQYVYDDLKYLGYEKIDILGVKTLRVIQAAARKLKINVYKIPLDDVRTYQLLSRGKTVGVFQFEHYGSQMFLRDFGPRSFNDVMMANALYRPGPMQGDSGLDRVIARRFKRETVKYSHPSLKSTLESTYGIMLYQEQVMAVVQILAGWTLNEADQLRWAIGKKKKDKVIELRDKFIVDCTKMGHTIDFATERFDEIEFFGRYGWNKAHAAAYGMVTYVSAYLKANHPHVFMCELLNADAGNHEKIDLLKRECVSMGIVIDKPHVNKSEVGFMVFNNGTGSRLLSGMSSIKYLGEKAAREICLERQRNDYFASVENLRERIPRKIMNSAQFAKLISAGATLGMAETNATIEVPF